MHKNYLTERTVCAVAALHTQGFSVCKAATNKGVLTPQWISDVLRSNCSSCLSSWITHLLTAVSIRSRATFVELLCGCLVSPEGWVTRTISVIVRGRHWTAYYKLIGTRECPDTTVGARFVRSRQQYLCQRKRSISLSTIRWFHANPRRRQAAPFGTITQKRATDRSFYRRNAGLR